MYIDYVPAQVCVGKITRIVYYAKNPLTERLGRVVVKCNRVRHKAERMRYARSIADNINEKLRRGWNPFVDRMSTEGYTLLVDAVEQFVHEKERELRKDSIRSYRSLAKAFVDWLEQQGYGQSYDCMFNEVFARKYMKSLAADDSIGARTYKSYLRFQRTLFFGWWSGVMLQRATPRRWQQCSLTTYLSMPRSSVGCGSEFVYLHKINFAGLKNVRIFAAE